MDKFFLLTSIADKLAEKYEGYKLSLAWFGIGLAIGAACFILFTLIIFIVSKIKRGINSVQEEKDIVINEEYKNVIEECKKSYKELYGKSSITESLVGLGKTTFTLFNDIARLYHPDSKEPIFEISVEKLNDFIGYAIKRIDYTIDDILEQKLHLIDSLTNYSIKDKKISFVLDLLDGKKKTEEVKEEVEEVKPKKLNIFQKIGQKIGQGFKKAAVKVATSTTKSIMDKEFLNIFDILGDDANKLYSGQTMLFLQVSKRSKRFANSFLMQEIRSSEEKENDTIE